MTVNTGGDGNPEYGPAVPYPYRNTLGDPWPDPVRRRPSWFARLTDRIVDTLLGRR